MSVSIDGKVHKSVMNVKYGEEFPVAKRSMKLYSKTYGWVLVYIISLDQPKWTNKFSVQIPFRYYLTNILEPSEHYLGNQQKSHLKAIK